MNIELVNKDTLEEVLPLILSYQKFYQTEGSEIINRNFFSRLGGQSSLGLQFLARIDSEVVGFATLYVVPSSVSARMNMVLNDLYVTAEVRQRGVGRALLDYCITYASDAGFPTLEWSTQVTNSSAQVLYDSLPVSKEAFYNYSLPV